MKSAIILISGAGTVSVIEPAEKILSSYNLKILDRQHIALAERIIVAFHIELDPAHANAISQELTEEMAKYSLDVALEILPN